MSDIENEVEKYTIESNFLSKSDIIYVVEIIFVIIYINFERF